MHLRIEVGCPCAHAATRVTPSAGLRAGLRAWLHSWGSSMNIALASVGPVDHQSVDLPRLVHAQQKCMCCAPAFHIEVAPVGSWRHAQTSPWCLSAATASADTGPSSMHAAGGGFPPAPRSRNGASRSGRVEDEVAMNAETPRRPQMPGTAASRWFAPSP